MCNLYRVTPKGEAERAVGAAGYAVHLDAYESRTVGPFQPGMFLRPDTCNGAMLLGQIGQWGLIRPGQPTRIDYIRSKVDPGKKPKARSTNNARIEGIESKPTFADAWKQGRRCLIPADWYQEPNWETGKNVWWQLKRADATPWFLAGLWSEWTDRDTGELIPNYTMLTCNCDGHPLLARLHKPDPKLPANAQDKRAVVHIEPDNWAQWLWGSEGEARELIRPQESGVFDPSDAKRTDELLTTAQRGQTSLF
jgi:putative SOS response-associated peptidase YedK